jgi:hypothetical protein
VARVARVARPGSASLLFAHLVDRVHAFSPQVDLVPWSSIHVFFVDKTQDLPMDDRVNQKFMLSVLAEAGRSDESRKASQENHISVCLSSYWRKNTDIHELAIENIPFIVDLPVQNGDFL